MPNAEADKVRAPRSLAARKAHAEEIDRRLGIAYPDSRCALEHSNPLELLVATMLSAQCTDVRVNMVTPALFAKYRTARAFAEADPAELEEMVKSTGFYRNKARHIRETARALVDNFGGEVPREMESLLTLPGVARKTANVVLGNAFHIPSGVVVDTHVQRISQLTGLTRQSDPVKIEADLMASLPQSSWIDFSHRMIYLGRQCCIARRPQCARCSLRDVCPAAKP